MIVCVCKQVSESQVREALNEGHASVEALRRCLGVGTGCGACLDYTEELVADRQHCCVGPDAALALPA